MNFSGFMGILFILARQKMKRRHEKMLIIAGKVRESYDTLTPYSGKVCPHKSLY